MKNFRQINERNQVTIPANILRAVGLKPGDIVEVEQRGLELTLKPRKMEEQFHEEDWEALGELVNKQVKSGDYKEYPSVAEAREHYKKGKR